MHQTCRHTRRVKQRITIGGGFAKANIQRNDQIGIAQQLLHRAIHPDTSIASIGRAVIVYDVMKSEGGHNRNVVGLCKRFDGTGAVFPPAGATNQQHRPFRACQHAAQCLNVVSGWRRFGNDHRPAGGRIAGIHQHVFGQGHNNRTRPTA